MMLSPSLDSALVRILIEAGSTRRSVGAGFLVTPQHLITCAHVINDALGLPQNAEEQPDASVLFDFPLLTGHPLAQAKILRWFPVREEAGIGELEDIAVLELLPDSPLPAGAQPAPLVVLDSSEKALFAQKVRMFGFPAIALDGTWANGVLQGLTAKGWAEIHHADSGRVDRGFSGTAVWSVRENAVCGMTVSRLSSAASYMIPALSLFKACPEIDVFSRSFNPYKGLEAFREKDARFYFGREADADELRKKIEQQPFTAVIGASGSGKSSLVFAGLLPILRQSGGWLICSCRPKQQPFHELAASLIPLLYEDELERVKKSRLCANDLRSGEVLLSDLIHRIADRHDCCRLLLLVDQFEELYTLNTDRAAARAFVSLLLEAEQAEGFRAVITLRADFLEAALGDEDFAKTLNVCPPLLLSPMDSQGLRQAVEQPAELLGIRFEAGLAELIAADVGNEPGSLPLLEFCLTQLWEQQAFRQISHEAYKNIGGVRQALARHAEAVYAGFAAAEQEPVRRIFLKLVRPGQGTEDTRQVAALADFQEEQRGLIKQLADQRLLVTSGDEAGQQVEVVHEALIRHWQTLRQWVDAEREFLVWRDKLRVLLRQWQESGHDEGALLRGLPLDEAVQWRGSHAGYLGEEELGFVGESEAARQKQRKRKGIAVAVGMLLAAAVMVVFFVLWKDAERQKVVAEQERQHAVEQRKIAEQKTAVAEQQTLASNYNLAKMFEEKALTALKKVERNQNQKLIYQRIVLFSAAALEQKIKTDSAALQQKSIDVLFTYEVFSNALTDPHVFNHSGDVFSVAFSPDSRQIASASEDKMVRLWDIVSGKELSVFKGHTGVVRSVAFSPDGNRLASASVDRTVRLWDIASGKELRVFQHKGAVFSVTFSPKGDQIASASGNLLAGIFSGIDGNNTVQLWDIASSKELRIFYDHNGAVFSVAFNPKGDQIASASWDSSIRLWNIASGKELRVFYDYDFPISSVAFSPDGSRLVSASWNSGLRLWDIASSKELRVFHGHEASVNGVAFSSDGSRLASASGGKLFANSSDNTVRLWDTASGKELRVFYDHEATVNSVAFSPDGSRLASASDDNTVRLWDLRRCTFLLQSGKPTPLYHTFIQAVKFLWQLDVQGLEIVHKERTPADMERFGALLTPPPPAGLLSPKIRHEFLDIAGEMNCCSFN